MTKPFAGVRILDFTRYLARLDLHHVGAHERQLVGAVRPRQVAGEVEDADARERFHADASRLVRATVFTTSNSLRRSAIVSGESFARSR